MTEPVRIVSISELYGSTYNLFAHTLPRQGMQVQFADKDDLDAIAALIDERTKAVYCESIGNPSGNVADIEKLAQIAHEHGMPLIVDNTVPSPTLLRPIEHGADIVVHAATKYICGHGTTVGGVLVDSGHFAWLDHAERFALLTEPDPSYHGVNYAKDVGEAAFITRAQRYMGGRASGILSFGLRGGYEAGVRFYDALKLFIRLVNIGDAKSCSSMPAATTHRQLNEDELKSAGVTPDMVRLSIGIEHVDDLIADLEQALAVAS